MQGDVQLSEPEFLYLNTRGRKSGRIHRIEIWFVHHGEKYYILSELGEEADWVRNIKQNAKVQFSVGEETFDGMGRLVDSNGETKLVKQVSSLMQAKNGWSDGLIVELQSNRNLPGY